jgi:ABC-type molybdenum transport system ATPase subunit/photorepair protein PhrA
LQVLRKEGHVMNPLVSQQEGHHVTSAEVIYNRRVRLLEYAEKIGNVSEACRVFGVSRTRFYEWKKRAERYGLAVDPDATIEDVTVGQQQRVEILKTLYRDARILVLDEPTAVLTAQETRRGIRRLSDGADDRPSAFTDAVTSTTSPAPRPSRASSKAWASPTTPARAPDDGSTGPFSCS